ncbi:hypothetical protein ABIC89_001060 [Variovorax boronicumulans]|uniref:hypothetical protein n=1 Tax=Variovorax boronicumulans TaxID=436515 RepID=UPI0033988F1B
MQKYQNNIAARNGDAVVGIKVLIKLAGTATPATIYSDDGVTVTPNPLTTNANGYFEFYVANGLYDIAVSGVNMYTDVLIADALGIDEEAVKKDDLSAASVVPAYDFSAAEAQAIFDNALPMQSYTALRAYSGRAAGIRVTTPGVTGSFYRDDADLVSADNGGTIIVDADGRRWKRLYDGDLMASWFGVVGDGIADDTAAIQAAFDFVRGSGRPGRICFRSGDFCSVSAPIKGTFNVTIVGSVLLRAKAPFATVTFDVFGGGTLTAAPMLYFVDTAATTPGNAGTVDNPSGSRRNGLLLDKSLTLQCNDVAGFGVFLDSYIDYRITCPVSKPTKWGVWAYNSCWGGKIGSYITGPGEGGVWLRKACNGISMEHMKVWGDDKIPTVAGVLIDGDNNGISFAGTFIEKVTKGLICRNGCGPVDASGIDFEQIEEETVYVDGSGVPGRINGPVTISSDFIETNSATRPLVYANNAIVIVRGSRLRNAAKAFEQIGNGYILSESNQVEATVLDIGTGRIIANGIKGTRTWSETSYSAPSSSLEVVREVANNVYPYNTALMASGLQWSHSITDVPTQRMVGRSDWFVCDMQAGAEANRMGIRLMYTGGGSAKQVLPLEDNGTTLGSSSTRWSQVYGALFRPGDGTALWRTGSATPEAAVSAVVGSMFARLDGTPNSTFYFKEAGAAATGWVRARMAYGFSADHGDADFSIVANQAASVDRWATPLTANRAATLSTSGAINGDSRRVLRTAAATGAFNLNVGTGPLKALAAGQWCDVMYDGSAWVLTGFGSL